MIPTASLESVGAGATSVFGTPGGETLVMGSSG